MSFDTYLDDDTASALRFADPGNYEVVNVHSGDVSADLMGIACAHVLTSPAA